MIERATAQPCAVAQTKFFGLLLVFYRTAHHFTTLETQLYRLIGELGGATLSKIRAVQEAQAQLERERWLGEFSDRAIRIPDLETLLTQAAQSLQDVVQADGVIASLTLAESSRAERPGDEA